MSPGSRPNQGNFPPNRNSTPTHTSSPPATIKNLPSSVIRASLEELALRTTVGSRHTEVTVGLQGGKPPARRPLQVALLNQVRLIHVFYRTLLLADGRGNSLDAH